MSVLITNQPLTRTSHYFKNVFVLIIWGNYFSKMIIFPEKFFFYFFYFNKKLMFTLDGTIIFKFIINFFIKHILGGKINLKKKPSNVSEKKSKLQQPHFLIF